MKKFVALCIFGVAFGLLEAIVVYYLHNIITNTWIQKQMPNNYTVLINLKIIAFIITKQPLLKNSYITTVEMFREFTTIIMLFCIAYVSGASVKQRVGAFLIVFSIWDIFYYIFLHLLINWPTNLFSIDVYFLIPVPWIGPVITPIIISVILFIFGCKWFLDPLKKFGSNTHK